LELGIGAWGQNTRVMDRVEIEVWRYLQPSGYKSSNETDRRTDGRTDRRTPGHSKDRAYA